LGQASTMGTPEAKPVAPEAKTADQGAVEQREQTRQRRLEEQERVRLEQQRLEEQKETENKKKRQEYLEKYIEDKRNMLLKYKPGTLRPEATQDYELPQQWNIVLLGPPGVGKSSTINTSYLAFHPNQVEYIETVSTYAPAAYSGSLVFESYSIGTPGFLLFDSKGWDVGKGNSEDSEAKNALLFINGKLPVGRLLTRDHITPDLTREAKSEQFYTIHGLIVVVSPKITSPQMAALASIVEKIHSHNVSATILVTNKSEKETENFDLETVRAQIAASRLFSIDNYKDPGVNFEPLQRNLEAEATLFQLYEQVLTSCEISARYTCPAKKVQEITNVSL